MVIYCQECWTGHTNRDLPFICPLCGHALTQANSPQVSIWDVYLGLCQRDLHRQEDQLFIKLIEASTTNGVHTPC